MKTILSVVCSFILCVSDYVRAADVEMALDQRNLVFILEEIPDPDFYSFEERVSVTVENRLNRRFYNTYRPSRLMQAFISKGDTYLANKSLADKGKGTLNSAVTKGFEEILVNSEAYIRAEEWLRLNAKYLGEFVKNSVRSIDEEDIKTLDTVQSEAEETWIARVRRANSVVYGIHPSLRSPHVFAGTKVSYKKHVIVLMARYHLDHFDEHRAELTASIPITKRLSFTTGVVYAFEESDKARVLIRGNYRMWGGTFSASTILLLSHQRYTLQGSWPWWWEKI